MVSSSATDYSAANQQGGPGAPMQDRSDYGYSHQSTHPQHGGPEYDPRRVDNRWQPQGGHQSSVTGTTEGSYPHHQTYSPHIPPASTTRQHTGSPFPPFSPHGQFSDSVGGGSGGAASPRNPHHYDSQPERERHNSTHSDGHGLPGIGHVRCYWSVLTADLEYAYLGPIFAAHLGEEVSERLLGTSLLDWVHPDERDQLAKDLLPHPNRIAGVEETGVFGSVTRYASFTRRT